MKYKAMPLVKTADTIEFKEEIRELPPPEADEVTLTVRACGVCGSDVARWRGEAYFYPLVIGHEFAGRVENDPTGQWTGKRAVVYPILQCGECPQCKQGLYAMCDNYSYYGSRRDGAFAQKLNVKRANLLEIPETVSDEAAAMCEPCAVALNAIEKARTLEGKTVAVYGAGTIGILLVKLAFIRGAQTVYVFEPDERKMAFAQSCGALPLPEQDRADVYFDACGRCEALVDMLNRAKPLAEIVLLGNPAGDVNLPKKVYWRILRGELTLHGTWNSRFSARNDWQNVLDLMADGRLDVSDVITHTYPITQAEQALRTLSDRAVFCEKVMLVNKEEI